MSIILRTFRKDPEAVVDYGFDWSDWLLSADAIATSAWTVPSGLTEGVTSNTDTSTVVWLSGGTAGETYTVENKITTDDGRTAERSFQVIVEER